MLHESAWTMVPYLVVFFVQMSRYTTQENAGNPKGPTFLQAVAAAFAMLALVVLRVGGIVVPYGTMLFGLPGAVWAVHACREFRKGANRD
jgi:hypothetical protein